MRQVHGASVGIVDERTPIGAEIRDVDVLVTSETGRPLVVLAADCVPILAAGATVVAAAHAGWRGLVADVPRALVAALRDMGEQAGRVRVALGPSIGPCCYEVGPEVIGAVAAIDEGAVTTTRSGSPSVDLRTAVRTMLGALGVTDVVDAAPGCTACDPEWFSHRRDPAAGRQAGLVVRRGTAGG
jgi:polyphenol oxidase